MSSWQEERLCGLRTQRGEMINTQCALWVDAPFVCIGKNTQRHIMAFDCWNRDSRLFIFHMVSRYLMDSGCLNDISQKKLKIQDVLARLEPAMPSARGQWKDIHHLFMYCTYHRTNSGKWGNSWHGKLANTQIFPLHVYPFIWWNPKVPYLWK